MPFTWFMPTFLQYIIKIIKQNNNNNNKNDINNNNNKTK